MSNTTHLFEGFTITKDSDDTTATVLSFIKLAKFGLTLNKYNGTNEEELKNVIRNAHIKFLEELEEIKKSSEALKLLKEYVGKMIGKKIIMSDEKFLTILDISAKKVIATNEKDFKLNE